MTLISSAIEVDYAAIGGTIREAMRPRKSGVASNAHTAKQLLEPAPDYQKMSETVKGERNSGSKGERVVDER